jgi:hypothetical protein
LRITGGNPVIAVVSGFGRLYSTKDSVMHTNWKSWVKALSFSGIMTADKTTTVEKPKNTRNHYGFEQIYAD